MRLLAALAFTVLSTTCHRARPGAPRPVADRAERPIVGLTPVRNANAPTALPVETARPIRAAVDSPILHRPDYTALVHALARYRALASDTTIPAFRTPPILPVRPGDSLTTVARLRVRLAALGDVPATAGPDSVDRYAGPVVDAVRHFQQRHGLGDDGIIGPETATELATPLTNRVEQIERSLERIRLEPPIDSGPFVVVNVPAFHLFAYDGAPGDTEPALDMKVVVGRAVRTPTPSLMTRVEALDFWPDWDVPRSILVNEIVPALAKDPGYLRNHDMEIVGADDRVLGDSATREMIEQLRTGQLRVRQKPGPGSALGRVKFDAPNPEHVFLHDTPERTLFDRTRRDFSHGCIRLEDARALAIWAMAGDSTWTADSVDAALAGPDSRRVALPRPIPVIVEYLTAFAGPDGTTWFARDIYGRDTIPPNGW